MYISTTTIRVRYADTDQMGVVYHGNYAQYFEVGRVEAIRQLGLTYKDIEEMGILMPVIDWQAKFLRPAIYDDLLTIKTILTELPIAHKIQFDQEIYNEKEELITKGKVILYFITRKTKERTHLPDILKVKLGSFFEKKS